MSNKNLLLLIIAGVIVFYVLNMMNSDKKAPRASSPKGLAVSSPKSSVASSVSSVSSVSSASSKREKFSYTESVSSENYENLDLEGIDNMDNIDNIENFQNKVSSESPRPKAESVIRSAKLGNRFGGGNFQTRLTAGTGAVGPNTTNTNGLSLEGAPDFTLGVTPVISKEKKAKKLTAKDLLPKESKDDWFDMPYDKKQMMRIENENLLAGASTQSKIGIDTQGQTLKNASHDLRAAPPNPKFNVGPWMNSTIEPDYNIKPLM
jgi:hypothetical protein